MIDKQLVTIKLVIVKILLRTSYFYNSGEGENVFNLDITILRSLRWSRIFSVDEYICLIGLLSAGAIRVSFSLASTAADVDWFFAFAKKTYWDRVTTTDGLPPRDRC